MNTARTIPFDAQAEQPWVLPNRGTVGMVCLIVAEAAIFMIFFVSYIFYLGKSLTGPYPRRCLSCRSSGPFVFSPAASPFISRSAPCARASSATAPSAWPSPFFWLSVPARNGARVYHLIRDDGLTIRTNLFGTTFYSLVGLHATHVLVGLIMLSIALAVSLGGRIKEAHTERLECFLSIGTLWTPSGWPSFWSCTY